MNMKKALALILALAMTFALTLTGCSNNNQPSGGESGTPAETGGGAPAGEDITLRFSTHDPETSKIMIAAQAYFDEINAATDGHVTVDMLASAVVASAATVGDMVSSGGVDMGWVYTSYYPTQFTLSDVITLPLQASATTWPPPRCSGTCMRPCPRWPLSGTTSTRCCSCTPTPP